jgi:outer membrane murein-binding lipoprotein Lpp
MPRRQMPLFAVLAIGLAASGCTTGNNARNDQLLQRQEQMQLQIEQLERRLNQLSPAVTPDAAGKAPAGLIRSLTYRSGTSDDRLRIYWSDGKVSDLPCTKEQNTFVCG